MNTVKNAGYPSPEICIPARYVRGICPAWEKPGALLFLFSPHPKAFTRGFCG